MVTLVRSPPGQPLPHSNALTQSSFATYVLSLLVYTVYFIWSLTPPHILENNLNIHWYPSQTWATLIPAWITVSVWIAFIIYLARNILVTPPVDGPDGLRAFIDSKAIVLDHFSLAGLDVETKDPPVPVIRDVPCQVVNEFYFKNYPEQYNRLFPP